MLPTPSLSHFNKKEYLNFYEPAEDSFLLIDALEKDLDFIQKINPSVCLEIGSGSGVVSSALASVLKNCFFLTTDINKAACSATLRTAAANGVIVETVNTSLASALKIKPDLVIFNPPYVPTDNSEVTTKDLLTRSWAGGEKGRIVIDKFLKLLPNLLGNKSLCYLLILRENRREEILSLLEGISLSGEVVLERRAGRESLEILRISK